MTAYEALCAQLSKAQSGPGPSFHHRFLDLTPIATPEQSTCDAIVLAVGHDQFKQLGGQGARTLGKPQGVVCDVQHVLPLDAVDGRL